MVNNPFLDSYTLDWELEDTETGERWKEHHNNMSLADFEILYGNTTYNFVSIHLKQMKSVVHD